MNLYIYHLQEEYDKENDNFGSNKSHISAAITLCVKKRSQIDLKVRPVRFIGLYISLNSAKLRPLCDCGSGVVSVIVGRSKNKSVDIVCYLTHCP